MSFLIAIEGIDGSGKTTLANLISKKMGFKKAMYPDRTTLLGREIDRILKEKLSINPIALAHLFSANRWETFDDLKGNIVVDRYILSGQAYAFTNGVPEEIVMNMDIGLPAPKLTIFLDVTPEVAHSRLQTSEKFETLEFQKKVYDNYKKLLKKIPGERIMINPNIEDIQNWYEIFGSS